MATPQKKHTWKFYRIGALDQVAIETADDLLHLCDLDQKLWVALSCPVKGLEIDEKTLALIDSDKDGRIRVPELLAAIRWSALYLKDTATLLRGSDALPLAELNDATPEGRAALASAQRILQSIGKAPADPITLADVADTGKVFAANKLNGDGILPASATSTPETAALVTEIIGYVGSVSDRSGQPGLDQAKLDAFFAELTAFAAWADQGASPAIQPLGDKTATAAAAIAAVRAKIDDFFARTRLAQYDARALGALNRSESDYLAFSAKDLTISTAEIAALPLARIEAGRALPLLDGTNPAWAAALTALHRDAVAPLFGATKTTLTETEWADLVAKFAPFSAWQAAKAGASVEKLGLARAHELLSSTAKADLAALIAQDLALAPEFEAIAALERLLRYCRDLRALLHNFVNFFDFYSHDRYAIFQAGTLYLDSRSTELCIRVDNAGAHAALAAMSKVFIAYVDCRRPGEAPMSIAACFTQGDSDFLFVGRNGIFYDRKGRDWDATVSKIIDNPISIRQAFWSPYKKFIRMIEAQVAKRAAAADAAADAKLANAASATANADKSAPPAPPKKFDVGIVAALGVAISGLISALTLILGYVLGLKFWQYPLVLAAIMLVISTPSMLIAWLKLRQRNLGPILEANGWAINGRVMINIPFGATLTDRRILPAGARRSLVDPYADKSAQKARAWFFVLLILALLAGVGAAYWFKTWPFKPHAPEPALTAAPAAASPMPEAAAAKP